MRGDRLLRLMLLLQARGKMTVAELTKELEVSERTVYRDLAALDAAGVPIVTERGPGGGCYLVEGYTTKLTGLTEEEAQALFAAGIPRAFEALGMDKALGGALVKLSAALPARLREREAKARGRLLIDRGSASGGALLETLREAVLEARRLRIIRCFPYGPVAGTRLEQELGPLGLVATGGEWFLVALSEGRVKTIATTDLLEAEIEAGGFEEPAGFDLATYWESERERRKAIDSSFAARLRILPQACIYLRPRFGNLVERLAAEAGGTGDAEGRVEIELGFASLEEALLILPGLGSAIEVLEPELLRLALADRAAACLGVYEARAR